MNVEDEIAVFRKDSMDHGSIQGFVPQALSVVRTVLERCKKESEQNALQVPVDQFEARVSYYTGYPPAVITQLKDYTEKDEQSSVKYFDVSNRITFIRILQDLYLQEKTPTYADLYQIASKSMEISSFHQFRKDLFQLGFFYRPTTTGYLLIEDPKIRFERFLFLNKIKKIRTMGTPIVYIDERIIDQNQTYERPQANMADGKEIFLQSGQYFLLHAISEKEVKNSLFSNVISKELFKKWVFDVLLKTLSPGSVIVMDSRQLHGDLINDDISKYNTKQEMLKYLRHNNVPCSDDMHKAELYELSQKLTRKGSFYDIDILLKAFGHEVLRLPLGCNNLAITEHLWNHLTINFESTTLEENQEPLLLKTRLMDRIKILLTTKWDEFEELIKGWENELLSLDMMTEKIFDKSFRFRTTLED